MDCAFWYDLKNDALYHSASFHLVIILAALFWLIPLTFNQHEFLSILSPEIFSFDGQGHILVLDAILSLGRNRDSGSAGCPWSKERLLHLADFSGLSPAVIIYGLIVMFVARGILNTVKNHTLTNIFCFLMSSFLRKVDSPEFNFKYRWCNYLIYPPAFTAGLFFDSPKFSKTFLAAKAFAPVSKGTNSQVPMASASTCLYYFYIRSNRCRRLIAFARLPG